MIYYMILKYISPTILKYTNNSPGSSTWICPQLSDNMFDSWLNILTHIAISNMNYTPYRDNGYCQIPLLGAYQSNSEGSIKGTLQPFNFEKKNLSIGGEMDSHTNAVVLKGSLCWTPFSQKFHKRDALMDVERGHPRHKMDSQAYSVLHYGSLAHTKWTHKYETVSI